jgi:hypothetical protein
VLSRLAARTVTSPVAFFVAGAIDIAAYALTALHAKARKRLGLRER